MSTTNDTERQEFEVFFNKWHEELDSVVIPFYPPHPHGGPHSSWDRRAAWLSYTQKGLTEMARGRKKAVNEVATLILERMAFLQLGYKFTGNAQARHTYFYGGWGFAFDGTIAVGTPMGEINLEACVDTTLFKSGLESVGKEMELTVQGNHVLLKSPEITTEVPTMNPAELQPTPPDANIAPLDSRFITAMELCGRVIKDTAPNLRDASIFLNGDSLFSTNGVTMVGAYHGNSMPPGIMFPKQFAVALNKCGKTPVGFGFNQQTLETFTVWFDDGSFMRTQTYVGDGVSYPQEVLEAAPALLNADLPIPTPKGFWEALERAAPFATDEFSLVYFTGGCIKAGYRESGEWATVVDVKDLPEGVAVSSAGLLAYKADASQIWLGNPKGGDVRPRAVLYGDTFRVAVVGTLNAPQPQPEPETPEVPLQGWGGASSTASAVPTNGASAPAGETEPSQTNAGPSPSELPTWN